MAKIEIRNELLYTAPTHVGLLADVTEALSAAGVNILALGAYDKGGNGEFLLLTSDNKAAGEALMALGGQVDMTPVTRVEVPNDTGELAKISRRVADAGINIAQIHATTTESPTATIVMRTDDEAKVLDLLSGP